MRTCQTPSSNTGRVDRTSLVIGVNRHSNKHAPRNIPEAQDAFKVLMIHWILQFALRIAFRCVLHRCGSQDIRRWKLYWISIMSAAQVLSFWKKEEIPRWIRGSRFLSLHEWRQIYSEFGVFESWFNSHQRRWSIELFHGCFTALLNLSFLGIKTKDNSFFKSFSV